MNSAADNGPADGSAVYEFSDFRLDLRRRLLTRKQNGELLPLTARVFDTLAYFVQRPGELLERDALMDGIWPDADVEANNLSQNVSTLRRVLGEAPGEHRFIATVPGRGYRFIADVRVARTGPVVERAQSAPLSHDADAERLYLQALRLKERPTPENLSLAMQYLQAAVARDPSFARAWCGIADAKMFAVNLGVGSLEDLAAVARDAQRALELDPALAPAMALLGNVHAHRGDWLDAEACFSAAIALDAQDPVPRVLHASMVLQAVGHGARSRRQLTSALHLAPADPRMMLNLAMAYSIAGEDDNALRHADLAIKFGFPEAAGPLPLVFAHAAFRAGRCAEAAAHVRRMLPVEMRASGVAELVYAAIGDSSERSAATAAIGRLVEDAPDTALCTANMPMLMIGWLALLERLDLAFDMAHRAIDRCAGRGALPPSWQTLWTPELRALRSERVFAALTARLGFDDYWERFGPPDR